MVGVTRFEAIVQMKFVRFLTRTWYYFRTGYSTYLTFVIGALNTVILVWYLAIQQAPFIQGLFGHFLNFAVIATLAGTVVSVGFGWLHLKRIRAYQAEQDITVESNQYNYALISGKEREVYAPLNLLTLNILGRLALRDNLLTDEEKENITKLQQQLDTLIQGGMVGKPRAKVN